MKPILFIDRDGTIIQETDNEKIDRIEKLDFLPEAIHFLRKIKDEMGFTFVMVTNQDGLGTADFPNEAFWPVHDFMVRLLKGEGITFEAIHIDEHYERDLHPNRKPGTGMLTKYMQNNAYDLSNSYVIGDRATDVQLAHNLGCKSIYIQSNYSDPSVDAHVKVESWAGIYRFLKEGI